MVVESLCCVCCCNVINTCGSVLISDWSSCHQTAIAPAWHWHRGEQLQVVKLAISRSKGLTAQLSVASPPPSASPKSSAAAAAATTVQCVCVRLAYRNGPNVRSAQPIQSAGPDMLLLDGTSGDGGQTSCQVTHPNTCRNSMWVGQDVGRAWHPCWRNWRSKMAARRPGVCLACGQTGQVGTSGRGQPVSQQAAPSSLQHPPHPTRTQHTATFL